MLRADYAATAADSCVLRRPLKEELSPEEVKNVFDYPRNLHEKCALTRAASCALHVSVFTAQACMHAHALPRTCVMGLWSCLTSCLISDTCEDSVLHAQV